MSKEVERKFLIDKFPEGLPLITEASILQGYLSINPEVRIRQRKEKDTTTYKLTVKTDGDLSRDEVEWEISNVAFMELMLELKGKFIHKEYKVFGLPHGLRLECSIVDKGTDNEFMYAEIEFDNELEARKFTPPSYLGKEITFCSEYKMKNYWKRTRLENNLSKTLDNRPSM